jgi:YVTN family beta-propeller protein
MLKPAGTFQWRRKHLLLLLLLLVLSGLVLFASEPDLFGILASEVLLGKQDAGFYLLPTNQLLRPWGVQTLMDGRPVDLAFNGSKRLLAVLNSENVLLLDGLTGAQITQIKSGKTSYGGVAFCPGDRELWASEVTRNGPDSILVATLSESGVVGATSHIVLKGHPVPIGIAFSSEGTTAYVAFSRNNCLALIDTASREIQREIPVGIAPFSVVVSQKLDRIYVSNRGGRRPRVGDTLAPTSGSKVVSDPNTGYATSGTLSIIDAKTLEVTEIPVGLAPSGIALSPDEGLLAVANGHSDSISILNTKTLARTDITIPTWPEGTLGSLPVAVAFAPDGRSIYVACGGNNAMAVVSAQRGNWELIGALPVGWFPSAIAVDREGTLRVLNIKGIGNTADDHGTFNARSYEGSLLNIPAPGPAQLSAGMREVKAANQPKFTSTNGVSNLPSLGIRHVFFIIKENRTYDQVFGDMPKGNGDPTLVMYGRKITPNHHALAERYVLLDNFYASSAISFDGHQWLMQAFVSDYVERAFADSPRGYAWDMSDALTLSPAGFFWQNGLRPLDVRVFGEFCQPARWDPSRQSAVDITERELMNWSEYWRLYKENRWQDAVGCSCAGVPALKKILSPTYPVNETAITDQIRAEEFLRELGEHEKTGQMSNVNILTLTSDHTNGTAPGSPTPRAMVADNDLALGRIVEGISKSRFWPRSLILVVEDDAQDGVDHVDGHRTVALAIGPHVRQGVVDSNHYNHLSMVRTIQEIFEIPPRTRFAKSARAMTTVFTPEVDVKPYTCLTTNIPLDEMNPPAAALRGRRLWAARQSAAMNWSRVDDVPSAVLNRILWWDSKGYDIPYPGQP